MIKAIIGRGIGFGGVSYIITAGFGIGTYVPPVVNPGIINNPVVFT